MAGSFSPLFSRAQREIQRAALGEFQSSLAGRLLAAATRAKRAPSASSTQAFSRAAAEYQRHGWRPALQTMVGTEFGDLARQIERFSRSGGGRADIVERLLREMGPVGGLIRALVGDQGGDALRSMMQLAQAMGHEVLLPQDKRRRGDPATERGIDASIDMLKWAELLPPDFDREKGLRGDGVSKFPFGITEQTRTGKDRKYASLPMAGGPNRRFPADHPIVTGEMVTATGSTNVHSYGYDIEHGALYVRFLGKVKGQSGKLVRAGPGSLYRYTFVTPEEFLDLHKMGQSKGEWVWDHLRIRGTHSGHQKDYALVGIIGGYVPRKATVRPEMDAQGMPSGRLTEYFIPREIMGLDNQWYRSRLPEERAPRFGFGQGQVPWGLVPPNRGTPDTGRP